jgi:site-specific DNA-methyltransferase (cytosine-N4-specific)
MPAAAQTSIFAPTPATHPKRLLGRRASLYETAFGAAYVGDSREILAAVPTESVDLVVTSPPYALHFAKEYGNVTKDEYVAWFLPFAEQIKRILRPEGSFVLNIGGSYNEGEPTRSLYHYKLLIALVDGLGFHLAQECFWYNPAKLPAPAEWVNVRRIRIKDSIEYVWWLSPTAWPKADNRAVLAPYSRDMKRLITRGLKETTRPSGHNITSKFADDHGGSIPSNLLDWGNNDSNSAFMKACSDRGLNTHPARYPRVLPEFFIRFLTNPGDVVLDPFAGSNTTGWVAEGLERHWLAFELDEPYLRTSGLRFDIDLTGTHE